MDIFLLDCWESFCWVCWGSLAMLLCSIWGYHCSTRRVMLYCTSPYIHEVAEASQQKTNKEPPQLHHQIQCDRVSDLGSEKENSGLINVCRCGGSVLSCIFTNQWQCCMHSAHTTKRLAIDRWWQIHLLFLSWSWRSCCGILVSVQVSYCKSRIILSSHASHRGEPGVSLHLINSWSSLKYTCPNQICMQQNS